MGGGDAISAHGILIPGYGATAPEARGPSSLICSTMHCNLGNQKRLALINDGVKQMFSANFKLESTDRPRTPICSHTLGWSRGDFSILLPPRPKPQLFCGRA